MTNASAQPSFDDLGSHLSTVDFCVVDLETTGGSSDDAITEFGAVRVRAGEVLAEFQTLINPERHIPGLISVLTGITDQMVSDAPTLPAAFPSFVEFARGSVLVAHNARFDAGFLRRACERTGHEWPFTATLDTVALARTVLLRDEVPNVKLATLARHFRVAEAPNHRALTDARATVAVLHGLLERIGNLGVHTLEDVMEFTRGVSPERRSKRVWASDLPQGPGVYQFHADLPDAAGRVTRQVLYVGRSVNVRQRVRSYFTAAETRGRMEEMVRVATGVTAVECTTPLQAEVVELRLIAAHAPRYNRRSKFPERSWWLKLTNEPFPRLSIVRQVIADGGSYLGPFGSKAGADLAAESLYEAFPIRQCRQRLALSRPVSRCALADLGTCVAPCDRTVDAAAYGELTASVAACLAGDVRPVIAAARTRLVALVAQQRFEEAATVRSRLEALLTSSRRYHRVRSVAGCSEIVAALRDAEGWQIHVIRYGRLAAAVRARPGESPVEVARCAVEVAETVTGGVGGLPAATIEETERIAAWLETPGVRLVDAQGDWAWPMHSTVDLADLPRLALSEKRLE